MSSNAEDMFNNKSKVHIADSDTTDEEDELLRDLGRTSQNSRVDAKNRPKAKTQDRSKLVKTSHRDDGTSLGLKWWETINPCRRDPYIRTTRKIVICWCFNVNPLVILFFYTLIGGTFAAFGIFYFFASILEFAEHYFFYADEFMAIAIVMALCGIWTGSKTIWVAHNMGHNEEALIWAPCYCPGFPCHKCCFAKRERELFYKYRIVNCCNCKKMLRRYQRRKRQRSEEAEEIEALATSITINNILDDEDENDKIFLNENDVGYSAKEYKRRINVNIKRLELEIQQKELALKAKQDTIRKEMEQQQAFERAKKKRRKARKKKSIRPPSEENLSKWTQHKKNRAEKAQLLSKSTKKKRKKEKRSKSNQKRKKTPAEKSTKNVMRSNSIVETGKKKVPNTTSIKADLLRGGTLNSGRRMASIKNGLPTLQKKKAQKLTLHEKNATEAD